MSVQSLARAEMPFKPVQANDFDEELERSLMTEWDAQIITYPNERFPFNEWILNRVRMMGYALDELDYLHQAVPQPDSSRSRSSSAPIPTSPSSSGWSTASSARS
jgi:hypothetical protein